MRTSEYTKVESMFTTYADILLFPACKSSNITIPDAIMYAISNTAIFENIKNITNIPTKQPVIILVFN